MKITVNYKNGYWELVDGGGIYNHYFSINFDISIRKVNSIIKKCNGINIRKKIHKNPDGKWFCGYFHYFITEEDAKNCLKMFEPYIILNKLTKE